ncbi:hypothetical protein [Methylobacterium sp. AMS5]|uniref:hypothetical protein n=1 Tax=Methylobacterium sp. AMS5 TaxID=925818 RepID=UPI00074F915B|nr:hypothetical protein [Methylobacterium sp. AMS5]AMB47220.1 hypothetical protein Y590_19950 [Methylobacterium sp. AMS5]
MFPADRLILATALALLCPWAAQAESLCERAVLPFRAMVAALKAEPGAQVLRDNGSVIEIEDPKHFIIWTLFESRGDQPDAYICRRVVQEGGQVKIQMSAACAGRTLNCDGLIGRILLEQNRAMAPLRR